MKKKISEKTQIHVSAMLDTDLQDCQWQWQLVIWIYIHISGMYVAEKTECDCDGISQAYTCYTFRFTRWFIGAHTSILST